MNVYELEKRATPGKIEFNGYGGVSIGDNTTFGCASFFDTEEQADATAKMFAHCRNNFMRALEALKRYDAVVNEPSLGDVVEESDKVRKLIAELEEVS